MIWIAPSEKDSDNADQFRTNSGLILLRLPVGYDAFGRIYEYFLGEFATNVGQKGGEFYTPSCIGRLLTEAPIKSSSFPHHQRPPSRRGSRCSRRRNRY